MTDACTDRYIRINLVILVIEYSPKPSVNVSEYRLIILYFSIIKYSKFYLINVLLLIYKYIKLNEACLNGSIGRSVAR